MDKQQLCPVMKKCGGCSYLALPYPQQLEQKQARMRELFGKYGRVHPIEGMENPLHYRNKVHAVFGRRKGEIVSGIYEANSHVLVPVEHCLIEDEKADEIIGTVRELAKSFKIKIYDEDNGTGLLRHVLIRRGFSTGQILVVLVTVSPVFPSRNNFVKALRERHPEITTVVQNINGRDTSMVLGEREQVLFGRGYIEDLLCGCRFRISPRSFYQVNPVQTEKLYRKAVALAQLSGTETVVDAYCGTGTIGIIAAAQAGNVIGVELNADAFRDAITNAKVNGVKNIRFYNNDATRFLQQMAAGGARADVVFLDPPRSGSTAEFIRAVRDVGAARVIYISCGPDTLARDLEIFSQCGYVPRGVWPFDLFPETEHVEAVVLLSKGEIDSKKVRVEFSLEDMDMSGFQKGATYGEIKAYVKEQTGLQVSSLYIAQVKQKCGIIERENYNKPKSENPKQPQCPPEKEEAIRAALKHFQMI